MSTTMPRLIPPFLLVLAGCGGGGGGSGPDLVTPTYSIGGTISGLTGNGLVLNLNGTGCPSCRDLAIAAGATSFSFPGAALAAAPFVVTVKTQPTGPSQTCTVANGTGTVGSSDITSIQVTCTVNSFTVGGSIAGLVGTGLSLRLNAGAPVPVAPGATGFAFPAVPSGAAYAVTVGSQPTNPTQDCTVANGTGTVGAGNVGNIVVTCITPSFTIGGAIAGLTGNGLVLQNNGANDLTIAAGATSFTFPGTVPTGSGYAVTVKSQPANPSQTCTVANGTGTATANVTSVVVSCAASSFTVSGTINGLTGAGLALLLNGGVPLPVPAGATSFTFPGTLAPGASYAVTVWSQPAGQTCAVANGSGTVGTGHVTGVTITCSITPANRWTVGGTITGLTGSGLVLLLNGGSALPVPAGATTFTFPAVPSGTGYAVTIGTQPSGQTCGVTAGTGTVGTANVTSVAVSCEAPSFRVGGTITALVGSGLSLRLNGGPALVLPAGVTTFIFPGTLPAGSAYTVTISTQPANPAQLCAVANGSGTVGTADVTSVVINCGFAVSGSHGATILRANGGTVLLNGGTPMALVVDRPGFTFPVGLPPGTPYSVTIGTQPKDPGHTCTVQNGQGVMGSAPVTNVSVICLPDGLIVGGTIAGYTGNGLTLRLNEDPPIAPQSTGRFAFADFLGAGAGFIASVATQPAGQTCTLIRGQGTMPQPSGGGFGVLNLQVQCLTNASSALSGTFRLEAGGRTFWLTFWSDGTYAFAGRHDDAACGANQGNGVEYGAYRWNSGTGGFAILSGAVDTNGGCGLWDGTVTPAEGLTGTLTRSGSDLHLASAAGNFELKAAGSTPGALVGSWQDAAHQNGSYVALFPDNTFLFVQTQAGAGGHGMLVGYERGCYTATASSITFMLTAPCAPDGAAPVDLNGSAGVSGATGAGIPVVFTGPNAIRVGDDTFLVRIVPN